MNTHNTFDYRRVSERDREVLGTTSCVPYTQLDAACAEH